MPPPGAADRSPTEAVDVDRLPPPPPPPPPPASLELAPPRPPRAGELTIGWRVATAATWVGVVVAMAAVWNVSVQLGLSTWWLGARGEPQPRLVQLSVFVPPVLVLLATINRVRWVPLIGLVGAGLVAAVGVADLGRVGSIAAVELLIAGAAAAVSIASLSGTYRRATSAAGPDETAR